MYGFNRKSGVEITEYEPHISDEDAIRSAIGQGTHSYTPSQISRYVTSLVNHKNLIDLSLIEKTTDSSGSVITSYKKRTEEKLDIKSSTFDLIKKGMIGVVNGKDSSIKYLYEKQGMKVAGKTGTAQISQGAAGYKSGRVNYLVSFCGYFPSEAPKYSCIVSIQKPGLPASGGLMAGSVFSKIAERVYAKDLRLDIRNAIDTNTVVIPDVKAGEMIEARQVLEGLNIQTQAEFKAKKNKEVWGHAQAAPKAVILQGKEQLRNFVPSVIGMGAKDAVYLLESKGLKVTLSGVGKVKSQSLPQGTTIKKGQTISIHLN